MNDDFPQDCDIGLAEQDILRAARLFRELASLGHAKGDSLKRAAMYLTCATMELDMAFGAKSEAVDLDEVFERR